MPFVSSVRGNFGPQRRGRVAGDPLNKFNITGGTVTTAGGYRIHTFTTTGSDTFNISAWGTTLGVEYLVIAGGGGGGGGSGGGGGAGGYLTGSTSISQNQSVTVGAGGSGAGGITHNSIATFPSPAYTDYTLTRGSSGQNSTFGPITTVGGGGGGGAGDTRNPYGPLGNIAPGLPGGSGGGAGGWGSGGGGGAGGAGSPGGSFPQQNAGPQTPSGTGGTQTPGQGNIGGNSREAWNATAGSNVPPAGTAGAGLSNSITGSPVSRAGGGQGGGHADGHTLPAGVGLGGGGVRQRDPEAGTKSIADGLVNTGAGAAGAQPLVLIPNIGSGGPGVVVVRYLI